MCTAFAIATGCASAPATQFDVPRIHPVWETHMAAGLDSAEIGDDAEAARHFRRAVALARIERLPSEELAFSAYRLGDLIRRVPELARTDKNETALALLDEARASFAKAYGPEHPVLLPVWARIAGILEANGEADAAASARETADRIAVRFFPEAHFLRERFGAARPAQVVHPLEVLAMLSAAEDDADQFVLSPN
jgi:hypothetical protein